MASPSLQPQGVGGGYLVCIQEDPNGTYLVSDQGGTGGPSLHPSPGPQAYRSLEEAFMAAAELFLRRAGNRGGGFTPQ